MRLLRRVDRLEKAAGSAAGGAAAAGRVIELVYFQRETRIDAAGLAPGELIAVDVLLEDSEPARWRPGEDVAGAWRADDPNTWPYPPRYLLRERVTRDVRDLGYVIAPGDVRVGRVVEVDGDRVDWDFEAGWDFHRLGWWTQEHARTVGERGLLPGV